MIYKLQSVFPYIVASLSAGILIGTFSIPVIFYTYTGILGFHTLLLDIITFLLSVIITFLAAYFFTISHKLKKQSPWIIAIICLLFVFSSFL